MGFFIGIKKTVDFLSIFLSWHFGNEYEIEIGEEVKLSSRGVLGSVFQKRLHG
jgi:hypothetical protein